MYMYTVLFSSAAEIHSPIVGWPILRLSFSVHVFVESSFFIDILA